MRFLLFIIIIISIGCNVIQSIQLSSHVFNNAIGAKHTNKKDSNKRSSTKSSMTTNTKKSKDSSSKYGKRNKKMDVVLYSKKSKQQKGPTLKERLEKIAKNSLKQGQILSKEAFRRAKVVRSSAFESMLLKATWPNNDPVQPEILNEIVKYSIPAFKFSSIDSEDDPYYMTMHKLWTKMCEKDWRTISKSLYILHTITRDCQSEACERFSEAIKDMVKTRNPKKPDHRYFDAKKLTELDDNSADYEEYIQAYAAYVIQRAKSFTSKFEEIDSIDIETSEKKVLSILKKAQQCIKLALQVELHDKKLCNSIIGYSSKLIALDLVDLWRLLGEKIVLFLNTNTSGKTYANPQSSHIQTIADLLQFYKDTEEKITKYLLTNSKLYSKLKIKIPNQLETNTVVTSDTLSARISQLTSISGGYIRNHDISLDYVDKISMNMDDRERIFIHKYSINDDEEDDEEGGDDEEEDNEEEDKDDDSNNEDETNEDDDVEDDEDSNLSHDLEDISNVDNDIDDEDDEQEEENEDKLNNNEDEVEEDTDEEVEEAVEDEAVDNEDNGDDNEDDDNEDDEEEVTEDSTDRDEEEKDNDEDNGDDNDDDEDLEKDDDDEEEEDDS